jgi:hypothetical protein
MRQAEEFGVGGPRLRHRIVPRCDPDEFLGKQRRDDDVCRESRKAPRARSTRHARLVGGIGPDNPMLAQSRPDLDFSQSADLLRLNAEITRQASMVSYIDAFSLLFVASLIVAPLILLMRSPRGSTGPALHLE